MSGEGDREACRRYYERCVDLARRLDDRPQLALALYNLSFPVGEVDPAPSLELVREAAAIFDEIGDRVGAARADFAASSSLGVMSEFSQALEFANRAVPLFRAEGLRFDLAWILHQVGWCQIKLGLLTEAAANLVESLNLLAEAQDQVGLTIALGDFSDLAFAMGNDLDGMRLRGASTAIQERTGAALEGALGLLFNMRGRREGPATPEEQQALDDGRAMESERAVELARALAAQVVG